MSNEQRRINWYYYLPVDGSEDREICQYMRLDYLIQLLETHKYYVSRRREFIDSNEKYQDLKLSVPVTPAHKECYPKQEPKERIIPYFDIIHCPTSCWTKKTEESYLMWKSYATEIGARIKSTIYNFVSSLEIDLVKEGENKVVCGSVNYKEFRPSYDELRQLFDKDKVYADEDEFRFYFQLSNDTDKRNTKCRLIPVNTTVMIDEILLSPFICKDAADKLTRMIKCCYGIENVKQSNIKLK